MRARNALKVIAVVLLAVLLALVAYAGIGYSDALRDAAGLKQRADALIAGGRGPNDLTPTELQQWLRVEDPGFWQHHGVDLQSKGAGLTTITQGLSKRLAFAHFRPASRRSGRRPTRWGWKRGFR